MKRSEFGSLNFEQRWSDVKWIGPGSYSIIFTDCLPSDYPISSMSIVCSSGLTILESHPIALPGDLISWIFLVQNADYCERLPAAGGVICISEEDAEEDTSFVRTLLRPEIEQEINNIVKQIIIVDDRIVDDRDRDIDIRQIVNVKQVLRNILVQVAQAGGNVNQIINQIARQVAPEGAEERE
jgi:hypothetical protein